MTDQGGSGGPVEVRRVVEASIETAFEAWTQPEHVRQWWAPTDTARCTHCEIDFRVGGEYRLHMEDRGDDSMCEVHGEFLVIEDPTRIEYTWNGRTNDGDVENTRVVVEFVALDDQRTEVIVRHHDLPEGPLRDGHREGWEKMSASFARFAARRESK